MAKAQPIKAKGEGPFGLAQTKLFKYILLHPGTTLVEIKEALFNDKQGKYIHNLIHENINYIEVQKFDNTEMPSKYFMKMDQFAEMVDLKFWVTNGTFKSLTASPLS